MTAWPGFVKAFIRAFSENRITQASAALCYYLTMTLFPLLIVVYAILGNSRDFFAELLDLAESIVADDILSFVRDYLFYIERSGTDAMLPLGFAVLMSYASAALRSMHSCIAAMQGGAEYRGLRAFLISFVYSLMLLTVLYLSIVILLTGRSFVERVSQSFSDCAFLFDWLWIRYLLLALILFGSMLALFHVPKREEDSYTVLPGAALSTGGMFFISPVFSAVISSSVKYSLVYGSLASLILLMLWLYMCCVIVYSGALFNVILDRMKKL